MNLLRRLSGRKQHTAAPKETVRSVAFEDLRITVMRHSHESALKKLAAAAAAAPPNLDPQLLFDAVRDLALGSVRDLIARGIDVNAYDHTGSTPLMYAARRTLTETCIYILLAGRADINQEMRENNSTALEQAAARYLFDNVCILLHTGAVPNQFVQQTLCESGEHDLLANFAERLPRAIYETKLQHEEQLLTRLAWPWLRLKLLTIGIALYSRGLPLDVQLAIANAVDARFAWFPEQKQRRIFTAVHQFRRLHRRFSARF